MILEQGSGRSFGSGALRSVGVWVCGCPKIVLRPSCANIQVACCVLRRASVVVACAHSCVAHAHTKAVIPIRRPCWASWALSYLSSSLVPAEHADEGGYAEHAQGGGPRGILYRTWRSKSKRRGCGPWSTVSKGRRSGGNVRHDRLMSECASDAWSLAQH